MKKFIYTIAAIAFTAAGCQSEISEIAQTDAPRFTATTESFEVQTRTSLDGNRKILWSAGDQLAIFQGRSAADHYGLTDDTAGSGHGEFKIVNPAGGNSPEIEGAPNIAFYPHMESLSCSSAGEDAYSIGNICLPEVQSYAAKSFANGAFPMVAVTGSVEEHDLKFKNIIGAMQLDLTGSESVCSISITGKNGERLSGSAAATVYTDGRTPVIEMSDNASTSVTLDCGDGVKLNRSTATTFMIALPPVLFSKGFSVRVTLSDGTLKTFGTSVTTNQVIRSSILAMPVVDLDQIEGMTHLAFTESEKDFANPERGFYFARSASYPVTASAVKEARTSANVTIFHIGYLIKDYIESDIAGDFLQRIRDDMQILKDNGAKCILRFSYSDDYNEEDKNQKHDATPEWVVKHIQQLKSILQDYGDVIMCFQAGFVGVWGEWYYTNNFVFNPQTPEDHSLRKAVVDAMLDALPADRSVALRTPMFKRMMYAESYADTLTVATAYNGSDRARIGCFNDCFGASSSDSGTFSGDETREYWKKETRYVLMGGETCGVSDYCTCTASLKDMEDYHWTYLNNDYHKEVIAGWESGGCIDEIKHRLGYRLSLTDVYHSSEMVAGQEFNIAFKIKNTGFAAPMNGRAVELVLVDGNGEKTVWKCDDIDPRYWFAGEAATIDKTLTIPEDAEGECTLYLNLPDPKQTLHDNPLFSIRLANDDIWEESEGYNRLLEITLSEATSSPEEGSTTASGENATFGTEFNPWE